MIANFPRGRTTSIIRFSKNTPAPDPTSMAGPSVKFIRFVIPITVGNKNLPDYNLLALTYTSSQKKFIRLR